MKGKMLATVSFARCKRYVTERHGKTAGNTAKKLARTRDRRNAKALCYDYENTAYTAPRATGWDVV